MLPVPVGGRSGEDGDNDLGPEPPDHVHDVLEQRVPRPETERFLGGFGEPEVVGAAEVLPGAVQVARGEQLLGTDDAETRPELGPDEVLSAFATAEGEVRRLRAQPARQQDEQLRVLVIGVGADHQDALVRAELLQQVRQRRDAAGTGWGHLSHAGAGGADTKEEDESERAPHYWGM